MKPITRTLITRLAWMLSAAIGTAALLMYGWGREPLISGVLYRVIGVGWAVFPLLVSFMAALIISHQPKNPIGWLLMIPAGAIVLSSLVNHALEPYAVRPPLTLPVWLAVWFSSWSWVPIIYPLAFIPLVYPTGRPISPRWCWVGYGLAMPAGLVILLTGFARELGPANRYPWTIDNPIGFIPRPVIAAALRPGLVTFSVLALVSMASLLMRYRRSGPVERQQIKWLLYTCAVLALSYTPSMMMHISHAHRFAANDWEQVFSLALLAIPVSIAIAITRYRLWDIDPIIRRTMIYSVLTTALAIVYAGSIISIQLLFYGLTGSSGQSQPAIAVSTLAVAALFAPLRRRVQERIDRRFFRRRYNAEKVLQSFASMVRSDLDPEQIKTQLSAIVSETLEPEHFSVWIAKR